MTDPDLVIKTKIEIFRSVLELDPQAPVFVELSRALVEVGRAGEAVEVCRRGVAHHPELLAGRVALVEALIADDRLDEAAEALTSARREADATRDELGRLDDLSHRLAPPEERPTPIEAETADPSPADGDDEEIIDELIELIDQEEAEEGLAGLGAGLATAESDDDGIMFLDELTADDLEGPDQSAGEEVGLGLASSTLADLYISQGLPDAAAQVYQRLLAKDPTDAAIRAKLAALGHPPDEAEEPPSAAEPAPPASAKPPDRRRLLLDALVNWREAVRAQGPLDPAEA